MVASSPTPTAHTPLPPSTGRSITTNAPPPVPDTFPSDRALELLHATHLTLPEIAAELNVSFSALVRFMTSDEGLALIAEIELAHALHARACAAAHLHQAAGALSLILTTFTQSNPTNDPREDHSREQPSRERPSRERTSEAARRAAHLLFRLASFTPRPIRGVAPGPGGTGVPPVTERAQSPRTPCASPAARIPVPSDLSVASVPSVLSVPSIHRATTTPMPAPQSPARPAPEPPRAQPTFTTNAQPRSLARPARHPYDLLVAAGAPP